MHSLTTILALAASLSLALALQVTSPAQGSTLDLTKDNKVTWASVSSDPSSFQIQLVNFAVNPPVTQIIKDGVKTSDGSFSLDAVKGVNPGPGYQINLVSTSTQNSGILAQSGQFEVAKAGGTTTSASFLSSTPGQSLTTITSTLPSSSTSGSSSTSASSTTDASASTTGTDSSASASGSSASASGSSASASDSSASTSGSSSSTPTDSSSSASGSSSASSSGSAASSSPTGAASRANVMAGAGLGLFGMVAALLA